MKKALYMETTSIEPEKTAAEILSLLVQSGARQVLQEYDSNRQIAGLHFILEIDGKQVPFKMPVRVEPVFKIINGRRKASYDRHNKSGVDMLQAKRVAWRQLYRWVQAQLAMIETGMVSADQVFCAYIQVGPNETLYDRMIAHGINRLLLAETNP